MSTRENRSTRTSELLRRLQGDRGPAIVKSLIAELLVPFRDALASTTGKKDAGNK